MSSPKDRLRAWPKIDSFKQRSGFVTLFLPYQPLRDNLMLHRLCPAADDSAARVGCLRRLWSVSIDDAPVSMAVFNTAERMGIGMRGLMGLVPLSGLAPGLHKIRVVWNPNGTAEDELVDDRYSANSRTFVIPIAFTPDYELSLQPP